MATITITINLVTGMSITTLIINTKKLVQADLDAMRDPTNPNLIKGNVDDIAIPTPQIDVTIRGVGQANTAGSFNMTYNGNKVFKNDQDLLVQNTGRFNFPQTNIPLP